MSIGRPFAPLLLVWVVLGLAQVAAAREFGPQSVVRRFCEADGVGQRVSVLQWSAIAPLVAWPFEPAWDHVVLIGSYQVGAPRGLEPGRAVIDVGYSVLGQVSALGLDTTVHVETVTFVLEAAAGQWRIVGPPPPPHLFWTRVDIERVRRSLEAGDINFVPNTLFVWWMLRSAGWNVPRVSTADLLSGENYRVVHEAKPGDVVVYLRAGIPYHVGLLEADDQVVSSTLNAGIVRSVIGAFPGEVEYFRLVEPDDEEAAMPMPTVVPAATPSGASAVTLPGGGAPRTPTPPVRRAQRTVKPTVRPKTKRTEDSGRSTAGKRRTPGGATQTPRPEPTPTMVP